MSETEVRKRMREAMKKRLELTSKVIALSEALKSTIYSPAAREELTTLAQAELKRQIGAGELTNNGHTLTQAEYNALPEDRKAQYLDQERTRLGTSLEDRIREFKQDGKKLVREADGKYVPALTQLVSEKDFPNVLQGVNEADGLFISKYIPLVKYARIAKDGKVTNAEDAKQLRELALHGAYRIGHESAQKKGFSEERCKAEGNLKALVFEDTAPAKEVIKKGAQELYDRTKEDLTNEYMKGLPELEQKAAKIVGEALLRAVDSSEPELEQRAVDLYQKAVLDYRLKERSFKEFYPDAHAST